MPIPRALERNYAKLLGDDWSIHPHIFRHAFATQKYTQVSLTDLMATYDRAHPKA